MSGGTLITGPTVYIFYQKNILHHPPPQKNGNNLHWLEMEFLAGLTSHEYFVATHTQINAIINTSYR